MTPAIELLIGSPLSGEEAHFLRQLFADFSAQNVLILANFEITKSNRSRQIDFVVITDDHAELLEHKNLRGPICGSDNGPWKLTNFAGELVDYSGENPWSQASQAKFLLSDVMLAFANRGAAPPPMNQSFFREFDASVCIYPQIDAGSRLTPGNFKVHVRGYQDCLASIKSRPIRSNWRIPEWRRFATESLKLTPVTLAQAVDSRVAAALERLSGYRNRLGESLRAIPPLESGDDENYGDMLIRRLLLPDNTLLLGPSGCGKSFHLNHLVVQLNAREEVPILVQARRYRGQDFSSFISQNLAPYDRGSLADFLSACLLAGRRPVLLVDGLNECPRAHVDDFGHGIQAFLTYTEGRLVASGHESSQFPRPDTVKTTIRMGPLTLKQKRMIYGYYSGTLTNIDHFCAGFRNAYDLSLAGKSHRASSHGMSRVSLYDYHVRANVPKHAEALSLGLLRAFAAMLEESLSFALSRDAFDRLAEEFLERQGASLVALDEIRQSRLLQVTDDSVSFEHELLFLYFRAEHLRRRCRDIDELEDQLRRPIHQQSLEFVLARLTENDEIARFLRTCTDARALEGVLQGSSGDLVRQAVTAEGIALIEAAEHDLQNISLELQSMSRGEGKRSVAWSTVTGNRTWTNFEFLLFDALFRNLSDKAWQDRLLGLYFETERALYKAAVEVAKQEQFLLKAVWRETVRCVGILLAGRPALPALELLASARRHQFCSAYREEAISLLEKIDAQVRADPNRELSLLLLIYGTQELCFAGLPVDLDRCIELLRLSFSHASALTRIDALELFRRLSWHSCTQDPTRRAQIKAELQKLDMSNPIVNADLIGVLGEFDAIDPPVPADAAMQEFHRLLHPDADFESEIAARLTSQPGYNRTQIIAEYAHSAIGKIFEDVYLGVYSEAYESLTPEEKTKVLGFAGMKKDLYGFATDWILAALSRQHDPQSLPVFLRYATTIEHDSPFLYEAATDFVISIVACAEFLTEPPPYQGSDTEQDRAWSILGKILFWHARKDGDSVTAATRIRDLWSEACGRVAPAVPDALHQVMHGMASHLMSEPMDLIASDAKEVRQVLEEAIKRRNEISTLLGSFPHQQKERVQSTIRLLGRIGNDATASLLQELVDDESFGKDAVDAIFQIRRSIPTSS
ncbi:MAG TPA: nuclease-related domain-containing protein [Candidatus Acidoferrales bacterium]|nr:nuclease-related domain-containing protein [Candidatus Acidoferrales bacterium]